MKRLLPWFVIFLLASAGFATPWIGATLFDVRDTTLTGGFGGALVGAAGALLGILIEKWRSESDQISEVEERRKKIKALIAAELVNVAASLIGLRRMAAAFVAHAKLGGATNTSLDLTDYVPRKMPFTDLLGTELLLLTKSELDVLSTLRSNLEITSEAILKARSGVVGWLAGQGLLNGVCFSIGVLAQAFEHFAPERSFEFGDGNGPQLATVLLKELAIAPNVK